MQLHLFKLDNQVSGNATLYFVLIMLVLILLSFYCETLRDGNMKNNIFRLPINKIQFGFSDGKNEARQPNFESFFYDGSGYYQSLKSDSLKYLVIGRKGTGKTILVRYFEKEAQKDPEVRTKFIVAGDFTSEKLRSFDYALVKEEEREVFWRYLILKELTTMVIENERGILNRKWVSKLRNVDSKLSLSLDELVQENSNEVNIKGTLGISNASSVATNTGKSSKSTSTYSRSSYFDETDELMMTLMDVMKRTKKRYYLFFDDLDEIKLTSIQKKDGENNIIILAKLLNDFVSALMYVNDKLLDTHNGSRVISTLRKDVADQMQFFGSNVNKNITDNAINITWFSPMLKTNPEKTSLGKLILHKMRASSLEYKKLSDEKLFNLVFRSNGKRTENPFRFIVNRGFGRPRDVIQYLNLIKRTFPNEGFINYDMAKKVQSDYCSWFYNELQNEISILNRHKSIARVIDAIKKNGKVVFSYKDIDTIIKDSPDEFIDIIDLKNELKSLFTLGAIGNYERKKGHKSPIIEYSYRDGAYNPDFSKNFLVHPALKVYLSL